MRPYIVIAACLAMLAGCAGQDHNAKVSGEFKANKEMASKANGKVFSQKINVGANRISGVWVSGDKKAAASADGKDAAWLNDRAVFNEYMPLSISGVVSFLQSYEKGITVRITPEAFISMGGGLSSADATDAAGGYILDINGNYHNLFNSLATQGGVSWRVLGERYIEFFIFEERVFPLHALQTSSETTADQDSQTGFAVTNKITSDTWADLKTALEAIKSENGALSYSPSMGIVIAKDTPEIIGRMESVIDDLNDRMQKQVIIDIKLIKYKSDRNTSVAGDLNLAFATANRTIGLTGIGAAITGSATANAAIINGASKYNGTELIIDALDASGHTSQRVERSVMGMNNTGIPFIIQTNETYLASITGGSVSNGVATAPEITPDTVSTSVNMFFYPRIIEGGRVILQSDIKLTAVDRIRQITSGTSTIEGPDTTDVFFNQTTILKDGQTLILSGSGVVKTSQKRSVSIFSGNDTDIDSDEKIVLMITARIID